MAGDANSGYSSIQPGTLRTREIGRRSPVVNAPGIARCLARKAILTEQYSKQSLYSLLSAWWDNVAAVSIQPHVASSGLSGALIWRVTHANHTYCLRRWPREHPTPEQLSDVHGLLHHLQRQAIDWAPVPLVDRQGQSIHLRDGHLWELTPWLPGEPALCDQPTPARRHAALRCLAQFHQAAHSYAEATAGPAPGLLARRELLCELRDGGMARLRKAVLAKPASGWDPIATEMVTPMERSLPEVLRRLESFADAALPLQWCLRDVKCDHVLFEGDRVSGLIDFGAADIDSVAVDIARLLGSILGDKREEWPPAIDAYHAVRPLSNDERRAIELFDTGGTLAASSNWLRWLFVEGRQFPATLAVRDQLEGLHARLRTLGE